MYRSIRAAKTAAGHVWRGGGDGRGRPRAARLVLPAPPPHPTQPSLPNTAADGVPLAENAGPYSPSSGVRVHVCAHECAWRSAQSPPAARTWRLCPARHTQVSTALSPAYARVGFWRGRESGAHCEGGDREALRMAPPSFLHLACDAASLPLFPGRARETVARGGAARGRGRRGCSAQFPAALRPPILAPPLCPPCSSLDRRCLEWHTQTLKYTHTQPVRSHKRAGTHAQHQRINKRKTKCAQRRKDGAN